MWSAIVKQYLQVSTTIKTISNLFYTSFIVNNKINKYTTLNVINKIKIFAIWTLFFFIIVYFFFYFSLFFQISLIRILASWFIIFLLAYWIIAAVWCLYDKDDYGRNVSASDDFYNIAFSALWLVEGFLLSLFLSYTKLFDFYDSFTEPEELESLYLNEDADASELFSLLFSFLTIQFVMFALDSLTTWEALNPFWIVTFLTITIIWLFVYGIKISIQFIEEFDFEEQNDDIFDEEDNVFEFEDFVEEGVDGGDYAESYEILQLFFSYWHYLFICLHLLYLSYSIFSKKGKQTHLYWGIVAICQNMIIILILDFLDWGELILFFETPQQSTIYSWFYISEDPTISFNLYFATIKQYVEYFTPLNYSDSQLFFWQKEYWSFEDFSKLTLNKTIEAYTEIAKQSNT